MKNSQTKFFEAYYRTIRITFAVVLLAALGLSTLQFVRGLDHELALIRRQFQTANADLELIIEACVEHVRGLRIQAEDYFAYPGLAYPRPLMQYLQNNADGTLYHLDSLPYETSDYTGNLTGKGRLEDLSEDKREEINMALSLNSLFKVASKNIPNATWVYYTSEDFINIYPHVPSAEFHFTEELFYQNFYQLALPSNNPRRELFWTIAYIDEAGKGLMVTCADPIYKGDTFKGSVSIDLTLDSLNSIITRVQRDYGQIFIVNPSEQLLAHPTLIHSSDTAVKNLDAVLPKHVYQKASDLDVLEPAKLHSIGGYYLYYESIPGTPWKMVYLASIWETYWQVFSAIGAALLFFIFSLALVMFIANRTITRLFIDPAQKLVAHIEMENANRPMSENPKVPKAWFEWFLVISNIFQSNRDLVANLELKVEERTAELVEKNEELSASQEELRSTNEQLIFANKEISETNKKITDSINYARRIQRGTLPSSDALGKLFKDAMCLYMPRDIVSGDFYWYDQFENRRVVAVGDCTGHGVPGAFMSMLGITIMEDIVMDRGIYSPEQVLEVLRMRITNIFQGNGDKTPKDGMNVSLCTLEGNTLLYAGAYHPMYLVRHQRYGLLKEGHRLHEPDMQEGEWCLYQVKADKQPIGHFIDEKPFTLHELQVQPTDSVYLFSDGYVDQFGGPEGRKYMSKRFKRFILGMQGLSMAEQRRSLKMELREWMGDEEQIDDVCVVAFKCA